MIAKEKSKAAAKQILALKQVLGEQSESVLSKNVRMSSCIDHY